MKMDYWLGCAGAEDLDARQTVRWKYVCEVWGLI